MSCPYCQSDPHNRFCPVPFVAEPLAGVATSDWVDAVRQALKDDGATFGPNTRDLLIEAWVLMHRYVERDTTIRLTADCEPDPKPLTAPLPTPQPKKRKKAKR